MKRFMMVLVLMISGVSLFAGDWADGLYFAQEDKFADNGWKSNVTVKVSKGRIVEAVWNGTNINGGLDKVSVSKSGNYPMVARGGAKADWHVQAKKAEEYLLKTQDPKKIKYTDKEGHTDAITGASIHVMEYFTLVGEALAGSPVKRGNYRDGYYQAEEDKFADSGWKSFAQFTVVNGTVVQVNWNGIHKDGGDSKKVVSMRGEYGMKAKGGAMAEWHDQAAAVEEFFLAKGGKAPVFPDNYHTDAITGATIGVKPLWALADKALK